MTTRSNFRLDQRLFRAGLLPALALAGLAGVAARADVTAFQQGLYPTTQYAGCVDTYVVGSGWAFDQPSDRPRSAVLSGRALIRFDLPGIDKDRAVSKAVLRLYFAGVPGDLAQQLDVYAPAHEWDQTATWFQYKYEKPKPATAPTSASPARPAGPQYDANLWTKPGVDLDETDYGKQTTDARGQKVPAPGLLDRATARGGPFGHIVELDVTPLAAQWVSGKRPNYGLLVTTAKGGFSVTSSDWHIPAFRPLLVIENYAPQAAKADVKLTLPEALGPKAALSPLAASQPAPEGGQLATVRLGKNSNCQYRTGHLCGYAKEDPAYPGNFGWTPRLRVGGTAGDNNHALFHFNLASLGGVTVKRATLKAFVDVGNMRLPADTLGQDKVATPQPSTRPGVPTPEQAVAQQKQGMIARAVQRAGSYGPYSFGLFALTTKEGPGWSEEEFTFGSPKAGAAWTDKGGNLVAAAEEAPVAIANVGDQLKRAAAVKNEMPETWIEFDLTGLVQKSLAQKAAGVSAVLDGRLMGGEMVLFSDDWIEPDRRPYLEVEVSPAPAAKPEPEMKVASVPNGVECPTGDYWVEPMTKAHAKWKGTKGTFAEYGDSITVTMAFWTPLTAGKPEKMSPEMQAALDTAKGYIFKDCWRNWKDAQWGNTGNMTIDWAFRNVDTWQKKMNPEVMVILFGTNDASYGPQPPIYTEKYAAVIERCLADGTVPIITTLPPRGSQVGSLPGLLSILDFRQAAIAVARAKQVPIIDFYTEIVKRQPENWRALLVPDGLHPSYPGKYKDDFSEEGLANSGYTLRNYLTLMKWYEIYQKVLTKTPAPG